MLERKIRTILLRFIILLFRDQTRGWTFSSFSFLFSSFESSNKIERRLNFQPNDRSECLAPSSKDWDVATCKRQSEDSLSLCLSVSLCLSPFQLLHPGRTPLWRASCNAIKFIVSLINRQLGPTCAEESLPSVYKYLITPWHVRDCTEGSFPVCRERRDAFKRKYTGISRKFARTWLHDVWEFDESPRD